MSLENGLFRSITGVRLHVPYKNQTKIARVTSIKISNYVKFFGGNANHCPPVTQGLIFPLKDLGFSLKIDYCSINSPWILSKHETPPSMTNVQGLMLDMLRKYGTDVTELAEMGKLYPITWMEKEIELVLQIMSKNMKNSPCLIGCPGIWLASIVQGLAQLIVSCSAPSRFHGKKVFSIEKRHLYTSARPVPQFDQILVSLIDEVKQSNGRVILFVEDVNILTRIGAATHQCIGALTHEEYKEHIERESDLRDRFQPVNVAEPSTDEIFQVLKSLRAKCEAHHNVHYLDEALAAAARLSSPYSRNGLMVEKALDLIDEAGARTSLQVTRPSELNKRVVTKMDIEELTHSVYVSSTSSQNVTLKKSRALSNLEESLRKHIIGQEEAVEALGSVLLRALVGIRDPNRPIASYIFTGPTGVGKTELAKAVAVEYFGTIDSMKKLDMSEFDSKHSASRLFGAPPGYVGYGQGHLSEAMLEKSERLVLFDEIEKADPKVYDSLLQILEDGQLTDGKGRSADFTKSIIILTSNVGNNLFNAEANVGGLDYKKLKSQVMGELKKIFRLELLNRLDDVIVFRQLNQDDLRKILEIMLCKIYERLKERNIEVQLTESVKNKLIEEGYDPIFGARPLRRCITRLIENTLAQWIADGDVKDGDSIYIDLDDHGNVIKL